MGERVTAEPRGPPQYTLKKKKFCIHLAVPGLSCGTQTLLVVHELSGPVVSEITVSQAGIEPGNHTLEGGLWITTRKSP